MMCLGNFNKIFNFCSKKKQPTEKNWNKMSSSSQVSENTITKILAKYMLSLVSKFSNDTLEYVKLVMKTDKSDFLTNKIYHASMMEKYLKRFRECMSDMEFINNLIIESDPKQSHSIEKIYQASVYDVFDDIERRVNDIEAKRERSETRLDIQIEFFTTFVRSFLKQIYEQMLTSKAFYFHRLEHKEQRQRIDLILKPLLSQMVHPTTNAGPLAPSSQVPCASQIPSVPPVSKMTHAKQPVAAVRSTKITSQTRIVHVDEDEDDDKSSIVSQESRESKNVLNAIMSSATTSNPAILSNKSKVTSVALPKVEPKATNALPIQKHVESAVVLPIPIRSAKLTTPAPIPEAKEQKEVKEESKEDLPKELPKNLIIKIGDKPESVKQKNAVPLEPVVVAAASNSRSSDALRSSVPSVKKVATAILTPMKVQSDAIRESQRQIQSVIHSATKRAESRVKSSKIPTKEIKSSVIV